ncbi:hypothetical protein BVRB_2g037700 [Beta vulgaris subsp. vulgaris]|nr:hypothetical protein BVRB_2g037700 [Beta vulgaris subsp. vulgaris]
MARPRTKPSSSSVKYHRSNTRAPNRSDIDAILEDEKVGEVASMESDKDPKILTAFYHQI